MILYTLRVTYVQPDNRVRVRNLRNLTWNDAQALVDVLHNETSTLGTHVTAQTPAWSR